MNRSSAKLAEVRSLLVATALPHPSVVDSDTACSSSSLVCSRPAMTPAPVAWVYAVTA